jgi:hypothetical protein
MNRDIESQNEDDFGTGRDGAIDPALLDRLVDGELDAPARRALLLRLESEPGGWRACALAFLEAQEFGLAARGWAREHAAPVAQAPAARPPRTSPARLALAATVALAAFLAGFAARGRTAAAPSPVEPSPTSSASPLLARTESAEVPSPNVVPVSHSTRPGLAATGPARPAISEYVEAQWARQGFRVQPAHRVISVEEGGQRVSYPVDGYRVQYVGRPTY